MKTQTAPSRSRRQFPPRSGVTGFTSDDGQFICTGSAMGRFSNKPHEVRGACRLRVRRIRLDSGGYDDGGAYWGAPNNLWQAHGYDAEQWLSFYTRAQTKETALAHFTGLLRNIPNVKIS